ncbi:Uncharacterized protein FWK35_00019133, partial [Aphis craccivora]
MQPIRKFLLSINWALYRRYPGRSVLLRTFKHCTRYSHTLNAVSLENKIIKFDKPIYIGFA